MTRPSLMTQHPFDEAMALAPLAATAQEPGREAARHFEGRPHPAYANMVGPFGGVTAAQALAGVLARPARTNRSTQHWTVTLAQTGADGVDAVVLTATAVTALRRDTWSASDAVMPAVPRPTDIPRAPTAPRVAWPQRYDMRPISGGLPREWDGAEADSSLSQLWLRDDPPRPLDYLSLAALADAFFPRIWRRRAVMTPIGTVSVTVYFHASRQELADTGEGYLLGQARAQSFFNGYFDQSAELWNEAGHLLATTHQIVYYKE